jgi:site-specific recombinase XerD
VPGLELLDLQLLCGVAGYVVLPLGSVANPSSRQFLRHISAAIIVEPPFLPLSGGSTVFDQLFERCHALARQHSGPLLEERQRYLVHLAHQGMARRTLRLAATYLLHVAEYLHLADRPGEVISSDEIDQKATLWANRPRKSPNRTGTGRARERFFWHASQWLQFLGRWQSPPVEPHPFAAQIRAFADHMQGEQSLSPQSIGARCSALQPFLGRLAASGHSLESLTIAQIDQALLEQINAGGYARTSVRTLASILRAFFRYAQVQGWCRAGLAEAIKAPRVFPQEALPCGPSWQDVQRLLASVEGDTPTQIRDRAILLLLAVYGFRAGEVARLRLQDFDWEKELLSVTRSKTRRPQTYPLSRPVGDAVIRYLREVRPRCAFREVFLTRRAPIRPLSSGTLWPIVGHRLRALGVTLPHHGPHALRHACATHLLGQGLSLKEISDHLGHRHPDTTRIYSKVDLNGLRRVADFDLGGLL